MKKIIALFTVIALSTGMGFAQKQQKKEKKQEVVEFRLNEMCQNCVRKINDYVAFEKGVTGLDFDTENQSVQIRYRADRTDTVKLRKAFDAIKLDIVEAKMVTDEKK